MKITPYEENCLEALGDAKSSVTEVEWLWAYFLLKSVVFALLYIGTSIREMKND